MYVRVCVCVCVQGECEGGGTREGGMGVVALCGGQKSAPKAVVLMEGNPGQEKMEKSNTGFLFLPFGKWGLKGWGTL